MRLLRLSLLLLPLWACANPATQKATRPTPAPTPPAQVSRMEHLFQPNWNTTFNLAQERKLAGKIVVPTFTQTKPAAIDRKFNAKNFLNGAGQKDKSCWRGDFQYALTPADLARLQSGRNPAAALQKKAALNASAFPVKALPVKAEPVKSAPQTDKKYASQALPTQPFRGPEWAKFQRPLTPAEAASNPVNSELMELKTIEDVRTLINKGNNKVQPLQRVSQ